MRPAADHSLLSPSGRMSRRARKAALKAERDRLFPPGYWDKPAETPEQQRDRALARARRLRELASRGMCVRKYTREADAICKRYGVDPASALAESGALDAV